LTSFPAVRVHSRLPAATQPWLKLWYLARALDADSRGWVHIPIDFVCWFYDRKVSTVLQWLREGKAAGAFRSCSVRHGVIRLWLSSLSKLTKALNLPDWGHVATVSMLELPELPALATSIHVQGEQRRSRVAAQRSLKDKEKKFYKIPDPLDILKAGRRSSLKSRRGARRPSFLLHVSGKRTFVSRGFIPFGCSQAGVARQLGRCIKTIQRHLSQLGVERRQIVQAKHEYRDIKASIALNCPYFSDKTGTFSFIPTERGAGTLNEPNGLTSSRGSHKLTSDRIFLWGGQAWMYRCNLYALDRCFCSMSYARWKYRKLLNPLPQTPNSEAACPGVDERV